MEYQLKLSDQALQVIFEGLGELKLKVAGPVFTELQNAVMAQIAVQDSDKPSSTENEEKT